MSNNNKYDLLWASIQKELPGARIILRKDSKFLKVVFGALGLILKLFGQKKDFSDFATTIWDIIYVPDNFFEWEDTHRYRLIRHEVMHLIRFRDWPFSFLKKTFLWRINAVIMGLCYILILPVKWTFRAKFEREGYYQTMLSSWEQGNLRLPQERESMANWLSETFGGSTYFYMWNRKKAFSWAMKCMDEFVKGNVPKDPHNVDL